MFAIRVADLRTKLLDSYFVLFTIGIAYRVTVAHYDADFKHTDLSTNGEAVK